MSKYLTFFLIRRQFYTVSACVLERVREAGAQCNWYDVASFVYNKTRKEITNGYVLPEDMQKLDFCWGK